MATTMGDVKRKGNAKKKKHTKGKQNERHRVKDVAYDDDGDADDFMTLEDKELLKNIVETGEESVVEVKEDGSDIQHSEILSFLSGLGIDKHRPFPLQQKAVTPSKDKEEQKKSKKKSLLGSEPSPSSSKEAKQMKKQAAALESSKLEENIRVKEPSREDRVAIEATRSFLMKHKSRNFILLKPGEMWRDEEIRPLPTSAPDEKLVKEAEQLAQRLLSDEISLYTKQKENQKRSEARWLKTVLNSGTLSDKMAALTLLVQESPLHNLASIETLVSMVGKKGRREAMMAADTLRDLFLTGLLPDDRKLKQFQQQPFLQLPQLSDNNVDRRDKFLLMWHFECLLKKKYAEFIKALETMSFDTLQATKEKAISTIHQLLTGKPEQENTLLPMLVNKLGDPVIKSKTTYLLSKLLEEHPNMKSIIVREIQQLLYRPNIAARAQYYAICLLTQIRLDGKQSELAAQLLRIYFSFFQTFLKKGDVDSKMMSALLTGVNRAYVFAKELKEEITDLVNSVYKIIPSVNFHTSVQALMLLYQVSDSSSTMSDRFYTCLYRKLADPALKSSAKQAIFMNLLFKSLKRDDLDRRIKAFVKRILQVYSQHPPQVLCGILLLLSQIMKDKPRLLHVKSSGASMWDEDDEEEKFVDLPAPKEFDTPNLETDNIEFPGDKNDPGKGDIDEDTHTNGMTDAESGVSGNQCSWVHRSNHPGETRSQAYDPHHRNPLYCRAELDLVWELKNLTSHYHPTVSLYAHKLLKNELIEYDGDPLKDFTLIRFLDRFVYKNPKKLQEKKEFSLHHAKKSSHARARSVPVNSKTFLEMDEGSVAEDDKFFFQYFTEKAKRKKEQGDMDSDAESVDDNEFDDFLDAYEKKNDLDLGDLELDFARDKKQTRSKQKATETKVDEDTDDEDNDESEGDDEDDLDLGDEELTAEFQKELEGLEAEDEDEFLSDEDADESNLTLGKVEHEDEMEFSPDEDDELQAMMAGGDGRKNRKRQADDTNAFDPVLEKKKKKKKDDADLFASAEEFAHLLEEDTELGRVSLGGINDIRNKDKSAKKQLDWEADRHRRLEGKGRHSKYRHRDKKGNPFLKNKKGGGAPSGGKYSNRKPHLGKKRVKGRKK